MGEDDGSEQLDPVGDELAVGGLADFAGLGVVAEAAGSIAGDPGGLHVAVARRPSAIPRATNW